MIEIIPAILTNNSEEIPVLLEKAADQGDRVQIDIIDSVFAANKTVLPAALENLETDLKLDFHLMVKEPVNWIEGCVRANAERIIGQVEMMASQIDFVGKVEESGAKVGLALDLETPVSALERVILTDLDVVLVMSVKAGFGGQKFEEKALAKVRQLQKIRSQDQTPFKICVDGGVTPEIMKKLETAGVDEAAMGRRILQ
jgi:ribulose-phosphate 3-epimerase